MTIVLNQLLFSLRVIITPLVIICIGYVLFTHVQNQIAWDMSLYMTYALNIFNGNGYVDINGSPVFFRGPVFPLLIAASYSLFGVNALSALGVVKLFCVLNPVLLYYLGKRLFSEKVGFATALLVVSSYSISFWSFQFIDAIWPFFIILHIYFLYAGFEQKSKKTIFFVLAGLFLGVAFLTKEVSLLFFPLGLLMFGWIKEYQYRKNYFGVCVSLLATLIVLLPWAIYLFHHGALSFLWGAGGPVVLGDITNTFTQSDNGKHYFNVFISLLVSLKHFFSAFVYFYAGQTNTVTTNFTIAPLFLVGWGLILFHALRGHKGCKILVLGLLLFSPIIYFIGNNHWRFGQVLLPMLFSFIALSYGAFLVVSWMVKKIKLPFYMAKTGFFTIIFTLVVVQIFVQKEQDLGLVRFFQKTTLYHLVKERERLAPAITGIFINPYLGQVIEKIQQLSHGHGRVAGDTFLTSRNVFYHLGGMESIYTIPMIWRTKGQENLGTPPENSNEKPLYVSSSNLPLVPQYRLYLLFESQLVDFIGTYQIEYIILSPMFRSLNKYFNNSDKFEMIFKASPPDDNEGAYALYRVKKGLEYEGITPVIFSDEVVLTLNELFNNDPVRYQQIRDLFLYGVCSLTENDVSSMLQSIINIPQYHIDKGEKYYKEGDVQQAIMAYKEAVRLDSNNVRSHCRLGYLYSELKLFTPALLQYKEAYRLTPGNTGIILQLANLYLKNGQLDQAIEQYRVALQLEPENASFHYLLGSVYQEVGSLEKAQIQFESAVRLEPRKSAYYRFLGDLYNKTGKMDKAIEQYQVAIKLEPENASFHYLLGSVYQEVGSLEKAQIQFESAIRLEPGNSAYYRFLGDVYNKTGKRDKAIEQYQAALKLDPENAGYHYILGSVYQEAGFLEKAQVQFESAIRLEPAKSGYYRALGDLYNKTGKLDKAIEQYQAAIKLEPENAGYHYFLGSVYQEAGFLEKAEEQFETAIRLDPENGWYHRFLGQLYELVSQPAKALEQYQQAVRLDSENTSFHYLLGGLYQKMMLPDKALEQYKELVRLDPENTQYQQLVQQFTEDRVSKAQ